MIPKHLVFDATPWNPSFFLGLRKTNFKADDLELCWHVQLCCRIAPQVDFFTVHNFHRNQMPGDLPYDRQVDSKINSSSVGQPLMGRFDSFCFGIWRHQNAAKTLNLRNLGQNSDISKMFTVRITATANRATTGELIPSRVQQTYKSSRRQRTHITRSTSKKIMEA